METTHHPIIKNGLHLESESIQKELKWLVDTIDARRQMNAAETDEKNIMVLSPPPDLIDSSVYANLVKRHRFSPKERFVLILAIGAHVFPKALDGLKVSDPPTSLGGIIGQRHRGFLPTGETVMFILAGNNFEERLSLLKLFEKDHVFYKDNLVFLDSPLRGEPELSGLLTPSADLLDLVLCGHVRKPDLRPDFPAKLLSTEMDWEDVVLPDNTKAQLGEIELWLKHQDVLRSDAQLRKKLKPGFRALFYGPPGTGKTLSACLIGKKTGRDVYRVDLSTIVSKYIGETEKNLAKLFDRAERKDWVLFFDEADALFGKRTNVNDSHDRYANQEVSYLLQRIEYHEGLVILATNMKNNIDSAFLRRFQSIVYFPNPKPAERFVLWQKAFSESMPAANDINLQQIADKHELSGSLIHNIVSYATLMAVNTQSPVITLPVLMDGIVRELAKEGRTL